MTTISYLLRTSFVPASDKQQILNKSCTVVEQTLNRKNLVSNGSILVAKVSISEGGTKQVRTQSEVLIISNVCYTMRAQSGNKIQVYPISMSYA